MSKLIKSDHRPAIKTIGVKSIDQLIQKNPKSKQPNTKSKLNIKRKSLEQQTLALEKDVQKLLEKKRKISREIEEEISEQRAAWAEEKQTYIDQANKQGYKAGYDEGRAAGLAQYTDLINQANQIVRLAKDDYNSTINQSEPAIIKLAIHIAEKIIHQQLEVDQQIIKRIVTDAMDSLANQAEIKIYVSPDDYDYLLHQKKDLENVIDQSSKLLILIDEQLERGMCLLEYPSGKTDASISTQLELIETELLNAVMEPNK